jgi:hypothetical protein
LFDESQVDAISAQLNFFYVAMCAIGKALKNFLVDDPLCVMGFTVTGGKPRESHRAAIRFFFASNGNVPPPIVTYALSSDSHYLSLKGLFNTR